MSDLVTFDDWEEYRLPPQQTIPTGDRRAKNDSPHPQGYRPIQEQDLTEVSIINEGQRVVNEVIRVYKDKPVWAAIRKMIEQGIL